jgi:hypothetical protein
MKAIEDYTSLVTSEHRDKPNFMAMVGVLVQPCADMLSFLAGAMASNDVDIARGFQLDIIGQWVGVTRFLMVPIDNVWFTFDTGPGFDKGRFIGPYDPKEQVADMGDDAYRRVIKAKISLNHWDGSLWSAVSTLSGLFPDATVIDLQTTSAMNYTLAMTGPFSVIEEAIINQGYFDFKPAGSVITRIVTVT